jgi:hypothetical protein
MHDGRASIVHVHGGSVLLEHLAAAGLPGERLEWCDPVCAGPTPAGLGPTAWYATRAAYLARDRGEVDAVAARLRAQDEALAAIPAEAEVVIWSGPELFCQAILMRLLVLLDERAPRPRVSLVEGGDQAGDKGCGLGHLAAPSLRAAFAARRSAGTKERALAVAAWEAFTAPGARALAALVKTDFSALPYLQAALQRHLADLPDGGTGLSTTETHLLQALQPGPLDRGALMKAIADREPRPWLTDVLLAETLDRLGGGSAPLVTLSGELVTLSRRGDDVLAGYDTWNAERWHGGILIGRDDEPEE